MKDKNFSVEIEVAQSPKEVFNAINNVRGWWSEVLEGSSEKLNDEFIYEHKPYHRSKQKLIEVIPDKKVVWLVMESELSFVEAKNEWVGTKISFEISKHGDKTKLVFTHLGLLPEMECYDACFGGWNHYLLKSLVPLITTGKGLPHKEVTG